jgi:hypothetical protein
MDKWDEAVERIKNGMLAEEPEAALAGALACSPISAARWK